MEDQRLELSLAPPGELSGCNRKNCIDANRKNGGITRAFQQHSWPSACSLKPPSPAVRTDPRSSNRRIEHAPVVGWPPVRSFRRNLGGNTAPKPPSESAGLGAPSKDCESAPKQDMSKKSDQFFVKINMEGVPIGRKINLSSCNSYEDLSVAADKLFSALLAAQRGSCDGREGNEENEVKGRIGGSREYVLVYEDNEGDRVLVGDVPWHMFVSSVKRLHVLKTSEVSTLLGSGKWQRESNN